MTTRSAACIVCGVRYRSLPKHVAHSRHIAAGRRAGWKVSRPDKNGYRTWSKR